MQESDLRGPVAEVCCGQSFIGEADVLRLPNDRKIIYIVIGHPPRD